MDTPLYLIDLNGLTGGFVPAPRYQWETEIIFPKDGEDGRIIRRLVDTHRVSGVLHGIGDTDGD